MIDVHCHIDQYRDPLSIVKESENKGIITVCQTNLPSHFQIGMRHLVGFKKTRLALGLHPLLASKSSAEIRLFENYIGMTSYIGEIGLDFSREGKSTKGCQLDIFKKILQLINDRPRFISVHSRSAEAEVLHLLSDNKIKTSVFHWYTGPIDLISDIVKKGHYFSVNHQMIKTNTGRKILENIPPDKLLTETDGPHIKIGQRPAVPADIALLEKYISSMWGISSEEASNKIKANFFNIINLLKTS